MPRTRSRSSCTTRLSAVIVLLLGGCHSPSASTDAGGPLTATPDAGPADGGGDAGAKPDSGLGDAGGVDAGPDAGSALDGGPGDGGAFDAGSPDSGSPDSGLSDAGPGDAGGIDAGQLDAGLVDAGPLDGGASDAGLLDGGAVDGGKADAGTSDAGPGDAGPADAGQGDAGQGDAGPADAGTRGDGGCVPGGDGSYVVDPYAQLSSYCLVTLVDGGVKLDPSMMPYTVNDALFADYAEKVRGIWFPPGTEADYDPTNAFSFPEGTIITKSFGFPDDLRKASPVVDWVETRLLINTDGGWETYTYLWDDGGGDATLSESGADVPVQWVDYDGGTVATTWPVPAIFQCSQCHDDNGNNTPIGPKARQLNLTFGYADGGENQLQHWARLGVLSGLPSDPSTFPYLVPWEDVDAGSVDARARAYLEGNCAQCHNPDGVAASTQLTLWASETDPLTYGVCKPPAMGSATYDIIPGDPADSYVVIRMASVQTGLMMPPLGRTVVDAQALALITEWIQEMPGSCP